MGKPNKWITLVLLLVALVSILPACAGSDARLDMNRAQKILRDNRNDINIVTDFLSELDYCNVYIRNDGEHMQADLVDIYINDARVSEATKRLLDTYVNINKIGNTIYLLQVKGPDIGYGIAYSINGTDTPEVQFMTELTPLTEDGWFFYISDYNTWRSNNT